LRQIAGEDEHGLRLYRCVRGTNSVEGSVHQKIVRQFGSFNASPELADCLLSEYRHRHNVKCAHRNRPAYVFFGHFNTWLIDRIHRVTSLLFGESVFTDWNPSSDFEPSKEKFGIVPLKKSNCIEPYEEGVIAKKTFDVLARKMQCRYPVLPVHTAQERRLFEDLIRQEALDQSTKSSTDFQSITQKWNQKADGIDIFYKLQAQLSSHYTQWEKINNRRSSMNNDKAASMDLRQELTSESRTLCVQFDKAVPKTRQNAATTRHRTANMTSLQIGAHPQSLTRVLLPAPPPALPFLPAFIPSVPLLPSSDNTPLIISEETAAERRRKRRCRECGLECCDGSKKNGTCKTPRTMHILYKRGGR
jgi:hypothetical protein